MDAPPTFIWLLCGHLLIGSGALPPVTLSIVDGDSRYGQVITEATLGQAISLTATMMDTTNSDFYLYNCTISYVHPPHAANKRIAPVRNAIRIIDYDGCAEHRPGLIERPVFYDSAGVGLAKHAILRLRASAGRTVFDSGDPIIGDGTHGRRKVIGVTTVYACFARRCSPACNNPVCVGQRRPVDSRDTYPPPPAKRQVPPMPPESGRRDNYRADYADQYVQTVLNVRPQPVPGSDAADYYIAGAGRTCMSTRVFTVLVVCLCVATFAAVLLCCTAAICCYTTGCGGGGGGRSGTAGAGSKRQRALHTVGYYTPSSAPTRASYTLDRHRSAAFDNNSVHSSPEPSREAPPPPAVNERCID